MFNGGLDLQDYDWLSVTCASDVRCDASWGRLRHPDIWTCRDAKIFLLNKFGIRGGFDWSTCDSLAVPCACNVSCDASWGRLRHPDIRTCCVAKNLFRFWLDVQWWVGFARLWLAVRHMCIRCQMWCILRPVATSKHLNLPSCKKFVLPNNFGSRDTFGLQDYDNLFMPCMLHSALALTRMWAPSVSSLKQEQSSRERAHITWADCLRLCTQARAQ